MQVTLYNCYRWFTSCYRWFTSCYRWCTIKRMMQIRLDGLHNANSPTCICSSPWLYPDFIYRFTADGRENRRLTDFVHQFADLIIQSRRDALVRIDLRNGCLKYNVYHFHAINLSLKMIFFRKKQKDDPDQLNKRRKDFLDILITARDETGKGLTAEEIRAEVDTFLFEGH